MTITDPVELPASIRGAMAHLKLELERVCGAHLVELRVYGSRVRGDARADSDLDVFILLDSNDPALRTLAQHAAFDVGYALDLSFWISPLVMSTEQFNGLLSRERLIARDIITQGIKM